MTNFTKRVLLLAFLLSGLAGYSQLTFAQDFEITDPTQTFPQQYTILSVSVEGNESTRTQFIVNASSLNEGTTITHPGDEIPDAIKRLYRVGLFSDVKVFITEQTATGVHLLIRVQEQPRLLEYKVEGVKRSERRDLKDEIVLVPGTAITEANVEQTKSSIRRFFREKGFWFTKVETRIEPSEAENRSILVFEVDASSSL